MKSIVNFVATLIVLMIIFRVSLFVANLIFGGLLGIAIACAIAVLCLTKIAK